MRTRWLIPLAGAFLASAPPTTAQPSHEPAFSLANAAPLIFRQPRAVTSLDLRAGDVLLASSLDGALRTWSLGSGQALATRRVHRDDVYAGRFLADGRIVSTGADGQVLLLDERNGRVRRRWAFPTWCAGLELISSTQAAVGCADLRIRIINLAEAASNGRCKRRGTSNISPSTAFPCLPTGAFSLLPTLPPCLKSAPAGS